MPFHSPHTPQRTIPSCNGAAALASKDASKYPSPQPPPNPSGRDYTKSPSPNPTSGDCVLVSPPASDNAKSLLPNPPYNPTSGDCVLVSHNYDDAKSPPLSPLSNCTSENCALVSPPSVAYDFSPNPPSSDDCLIVPPPNSPSGQILMESLHPSHTKDPPLKPSKTTNEEIAPVLYPSTRNSRTDELLSNKPKNCSHKLTKSGHTNISRSTAITCQESECIYKCRTIVQLRKHLTIVHGMKMEVENLTFRTAEGMQY